MLLLKGNNLTVMAITRRYAADYFPFTAHLHVLCLLTFGSLKMFKSANPVLLEMQESLLEAE